MRRRVIGISGSLIWSKTLMELIFNPCGEIWRAHLAKSTLLSFMLGPRRDVDCEKAEWSSMTSQSRILSSSALDTPDSPLTSQIKVFSQVWQCMGSKTHLQTFRCWNWPSSLSIHFWLLFKKPPSMMTSVILCSFNENPMLLLGFGEEKYLYFVNKENAN